MIAVKPTPSPQVSCTQRAAYVVCARCGVARDAGTVVPCVVVRVCVAIQQAV